MTHHCRSRESEDMITEHSIVVLNHDRSDDGLHAGDVGAIVFVHGDGTAYEVEFVDGDGSTVALVTLDGSEIRSLAPGELLHARRRDGAEPSDATESST